MTVGALSGRSTRPENDLALRPPAWPVIPMNNGTSESTGGGRLAAAQRTAPAPASELERIKDDLLKAEVRLARARATAAGAEVDVRVLTTQLRKLAR